MKITALKEIRFPFIGGKVYAAGDELEVNEAEAEALIAGELASAAVDATPSKRKYQRRDLQAENSK